MSKRSAIPALAGPKPKSKKIQGVSKSELARLKQLAGRSNEGKSKSMTAVDKDGISRGGGYDLWDEPAAEPKKKKTKSESDFTSDLPIAISHNKATVAPATIKENPIAVIKGSEAVAVPDAGRSYNPSIEAWKDLIQREHDKEQEREDERLRLLERQHKIEEIMASTLGDVEVVSGEEDNDEEEHESNLSKGLSVNKPVSVKIKTAAQRNKEKRHKEKMALQVELRALKAQLKDLARVPQLLKDEEAKLAAAQKKEKIRRDGRRLGTKHAVMKAPLEVKLSDELNDCLRRLKPEGNLARDRFRSLQERGIIEARIPQSKKRKYAVKTTEKWQYKDIKL